MNLIVTSGDLNGIGIECFVKAHKNLIPFLEKKDVKINLVIHKELYTRYLELCNLECYGNISRINFIEPNSNKIDLEIGKGTSDSGAYAFNSIMKGLEKCKEDPESTALLTLPISKSHIYKSGMTFPGHTELIADFFNDSNPLMILFDKKIRVALATIHIPLKSVSDAITENLLIERISTLDLSLMKDFGIKKPKIAILGLNPHAGESGDIGNEEVEIYSKVIKYLSNKINCNGPFPADGFFAFGSYKNYDGILASYHDQGLIPLKLLAKGAGVNFTSNISIVRTSPDHGTAFDLAGKNVAESKSTEETIISAIEIYENRKKYKFFK